MGLNPQIVGTETKPYRMEYGWRDTVLYALGVGAKRDELDYLYEGRGPKVYPSFGVVPAYAAVWELLERSGGNFGMMVHLAQTVRLLAPIPPQGTAITVARAEAVYDLKRLAQLVCVARTEVGGAPICTTEWTLLFRGDGGFGGAPPPKTKAPKLSDDTAPDWTHEERIADEQALLYRLSGDHNPLHADPEFARAAGFAQPILHGLATFGFIARAVIRNACAGDGDRLRLLSAQFRRPVLPGDTLTTLGFEANGQVAIKAFTADGGEVGQSAQKAAPANEVGQSAQKAAPAKELIVTNCYAEVAPKP